MRWKMFKLFIWFGGLFIANAALSFDVVDVAQSDGSSRAILAIDNDSESSANLTISESPAWWQVSFDDPIHIAEVELNLSAEHDFNLELIVDNGLFASTRIVRSEGSIHRFVDIGNTSTRSLRLRIWSENSSTLSLTEVSIVTREPSLSEVAPTRDYAPLFLSVSNDNSTFEEIALDVSPQILARMDLEETTTLASFTPSSDLNIVPQTNLNNKIKAHIRYWSGLSVVDGITAILQDINENVLAESVVNTDGVIEISDVLHDSVAIRLNRPDGVPNDARVITSADALAALKIAVGLSPNGDEEASPYQMYAADYNRDGRVSSADALAILKVAVGLSTDLPQWLFVDANQTLSMVDRNSVPNLSEAFDLDAEEFSSGYYHAIMTGDVNGSLGTLSSQGSFADIDFDGDGLANALDDDDDNDSVPDVVDLFPYNPLESTDTDGDGIGNYRDLDDDGDGVADLLDFFPLDVTRFENPDKAPDSIIFSPVDQLTAGKPETFGISYDLLTLQGESFQVLWSLQKPSSSYAILDSAIAENVTFKADVPGDYVLSLSVSDGVITETASLSFNAKLIPPPKPDFESGIVPELTIVDRFDGIRLLTQTTYGGTPASLDRLMSLGASAWFDEQLTTSQTSWLETKLKWNDYYNDEFIAPSLETFWDISLNAEDQFRQRMILAWSELFVVSTTSTLGSYHNAANKYLDTLGQHAFGNFRDLLEAVTKSAAMGLYLNMLGNQKADPVNNIRPDENFAREVMQLFTIGLVELNQDGTARLDENGDIQETYTQDTIREYAKVYTGWHLQGTTEESWPNVSAIFADIGRLAVFPMEPVEAYHQKTEKYLLNGYYVPPGQTAEQDLQIALDSLFYHPNVAPFVTKFLIQRFITSNPSPEYVGRVAAVFNNNGEGVRGDIKAVMKALLFDQEARAPVASQGEYFGKLKEPMVRATQMFRLFDVSTPGGIPLFSYEEDLGQFILRSPTVFNFFRPDFAPIGTIRDLGLAAPEAQIINEANIVKLINQVGHYAIYNPGPASLYVHKNILGLPICNDCPLLNLDEEISVLMDGGKEALVDHLLFYMLPEQQNDEIKVWLLTLIEELASNITEPDFNNFYIPGDFTPEEQAMIAMASREQIIGLLVFALSSSPEFAVQR